MPLETRIAAINLTIPQREPRTLDVDTERWLIDNFALIRYNLEQLRAEVDLLNLIVPKLVPAAYGSMDINSPPVASADIPAGATNWLPVTFYDNISIPGLGCTIDDVAGTITFSPNVTGIWEMMVNASFDCTSSGNRRQVNIRLFNVTDAIQLGNIFKFQIGQNAPGAVFTLDVLVTVPLALANKAIRIEVGEASLNVTGVSWTSLSWGVHFVDQLENLLDPT